MSPKTNKVLASIFFVCAIALFVQVQDTYAFSGAGEGTVENPYKIANSTQLNEVRNEMSAHYILINDINLNNASFTPIGGLGNAFTGVFNGNGKIISNLYISAQSNTGLFGYTSNAKLKNITIENATVTGDSAVGALAGSAYGGSVENCVARGTGKIKGNTMGRVGGLIGLTSGTITRCGSSLSVEGGDVGGLIGTCNSGAVVTKSYATGSVKCSSTYCFAGGLIGMFYGAEISECYATGSVTSGDYTGGLIGWCSNQKIENCYATGNVSGVKTYSSGLASHDKSKPQITNCFSVGTVSGGTKYGLTLDTAVVTNSYFNSTTTSITTPTTQARTTTQLKTQSTFVGWDFNNIWSFTSNSYPTLRNATVQIIGTPLNVTASSITSFGTTLSWGAATGATSYDVYVADGNIKSASSTSIALTNLTPNTKYNLKVRAKNSIVTGDWSDTITVTTLPVSVLDAPTNLAVSQKTHNSVSLTWTAVAYATEYEVDYGGASTMIVSGNEAMVSNLTPSTSYTIKVRAKNTIVASEWSSPITVVTEKDPSIIGNSETTIYVKTGENYQVVLTAKNVQTFSNVVYKVTYNASQLTLADFAAQTSPLDTGTGKIPNTDIEILSHSNGVITFKVNKSINSGEKWSGTLTILDFKSKVTNNTVIKFEQ